MLELNRDVLAYLKVVSYNVQRIERINVSTDQYKQSLQTLFVQDGIQMFKDCNLLTDPEVKLGTQSIIPASVPSYYTVFSQIQ